MDAREALAARVNGIASTATTAAESAPTGADATEDLNAKLAKSLADADAIREAIAKRDASKPFAPVASPGSGTKWYQVKQGDTLASIASALGLANPYHELYQPNIGALGELPTGEIKAGIWLEYRDSVAPQTDRAAAGTWF